MFCLASGGGQQGPNLAAAQAIVIVLDCSHQQLGRDRAVAERNGLALETVQADMTDLSLFADRCLDLVIHPVANVYIPDVEPVWREAARVLRSGGRPLAGFMNPMISIVNQDRLARGEHVVRHPLPYSELSTISAEEQPHLIAGGDTLQFSHTLTAQLGGQLRAGLQITGFHEDRCAGHRLAGYMPMHFAACAIKS